MIKAFAKKAKKQKSQLQKNIKSNNKKQIFSYLDNFSNYLIIALVIIALVLGYQISNTDTPSREASDTETQETAVTSNNQDTPDELSLAYLAQQFPNADSTQEDVETFDKLVGDNAKDTTSLLITNCEADPMIIRFPKESEVSIKNNDDIDHVISFEEFSVDVPAGQEVTEVIGENLGHGGVGNFGFLCDGNLGGVFQIIPQ